MRSRPRLSVMEWAMLAGIATLAGFYIASIGPYWNISPDSATYVGGARSLAAGQGFGPRPFHPPVTSLVFAAAVYAVPDGYVALNALNTMVLLAGLGVALVVLGRRGDRARALLCVLLALACLHTYRESTQLLSEPTYLLVSLLALLFLDLPGGARQPDALPHGDTSRRRLREAAGAVMLIVVAMTRTIGLTLALAVIVVEGVGLLFRRRVPRLVPAMGAVAALLAVAWWESYVARSGSPTKFEMFLLRDPWSAESGLLSAGELLGRMLDNARTVAAVGSIAINRYSTGVASIDLVLGASAALLFIAGIAVALRRRFGLLEAYSLFYLAVVFAHVLGGGFDPFRHLVPVVPLLFLFTAELLADLVRRLPRTVPAWTWRTASALFVAWYAGLGVREAAAGVRREHSSPFGDFNIKRQSNFDVQRVAMMVRDLSGPAERYASQQIDMFDILTSRRGRSIPPAARENAGALASWVAEWDISYVIVDNKARGNDGLVALMRSRSDLFEPVVELPYASLYRVRRPSG